MSAEEITAWVNNHETVDVKCGDPELHKGGMMTKSFVDFRVSITTASGTNTFTRHRFSDFEKLRNSLYSSFAGFGLYIPPLPPKTTMNSSTNPESSFVKERIQGLTMFCKYIAACPFFSNDSSWIEFCGGSSTENVGQQMLINILRLLETPFKFTILSRVETIKEEITAIKLSAEAALAAAKKVQDAEKTVSAAHGVLAEAMTAWSTSEIARVQSLNAIPFDATEPLIGGVGSVKSTLNNYSEHCINRTQTHEYSSLFLISALQYELSMCESLKELLSVHNELLASVGEVGNKLEKANMNPQKSHKVEEYQHKLAMCETDRESWYKGFIYFSIPMVARFRAQILRTTLSHMGASLLASSSAQHVAIKQYFQKSELNSEEAVNESRQVAEAIGSFYYGNDIIDHGIPVPTTYYSVPILDGLFEAAKSGNYDALVGGKTASGAPAARFGSNAPPPAPGQDEETVEI